MIRYGFERIALSGSQVVILSVQNISACVVRVCLSVCVFESEKEVERDCVCVFVCCISVCVCKCVCVCMCVV